MDEQRGRARALENQVDAQGMQLRTLAEEVRAAGQERILQAAVQAACGVLQGVKGSVDPPELRSQPPARGRR